MQLVILDRDGVINEVTDHVLQSPSDWKPVRGSLEAIARLSNNGWRVVVLVNQPSASDQDIEMMIRVNDVMQRRVRETGGLIDGVFYCPHLATEHCQCKRPAPGLLLDVASRLRIRLRNVPLIGDGLSDMTAAEAAGALPILVKTGHGFGTAALPEFNPAIPVFDDLYSAVDSLIGRLPA